VEIIPDKPVPEALRLWNALRDDITSIRPRAQVLFHLGAHALPDEPVRPKGV
jgi:hypothetical protein